METRRFGRTGHMSTVAIFGAAAVMYGNTQAEADKAMEQVIAAGVNHIDVAPTYGDSELLLGPWMERERERFFLGCKTEERTYEGAWSKLHSSLKRLRVDQFDLYQIHAITTFEQLDVVTQPHGVLDAVREAREQGLTRWIGITGHGVQSPAVFREALRRFDFDSVLFPVNFILWANPEYRQEAEALLQECRAKDVGVMAIKPVAKAPWGDRPHTHAPWYEPFDSPEWVDASVHFALSQDITGICTVSDIHLLPRVLEACDNFRPLSATEQEDLIARAGQFEPLFA